MGIRHLETYIRKSVPNGTFQTSILRQIENCKARGGRPLIVIDIMGFHPSFQMPEEVLCGYRAMAYCRRVEEFFRSLVDAGAELVFFEDGALQSEKTETWFLRRDESYKRFLRLVDDVGRGMPVPELVAKFREYFRDMNQNGSMFNHIVMQFGPIFQVQHVETDLALAHFATQHNALAIFASDTDFLIYPGNWRYWSIKDISFHDRTTLEYNKGALRSSLGLSEKQMVFLSTLGGNDMVQYDDIRGFHFKLGGRDKFQSIANFVRRLPLNDENFVSRSSEFFSHHQDCHNEKFKDMLRASLAMYSYDTMSTIEEIKDPLLRRCFIEKKPAVYKILMEYPHLICFGFDDLRSYVPGGKAKCLNALVLELTMRKVGVILQHKGEPNKLLRVNTRLCHEELPHQMEVRPIFPDIRVPPLERIVFAHPNDGLDGTRIALLGWIFKGAFNHEALFNLNPFFIPLVGVLAYLIQESDLTVEEADIFVCAQQDVISGRVPLNLHPPQHLNLRAFKLVFQLVRLKNFFRKTLDVLGLERFKVLSLFDGYWFHLLHQKWFVMDIDELLERLNEIRQYRSIYAN